MTTTLADPGRLINLTFRPPSGQVEIEACRALCRRVFQNPSSPAIPLPVESPKRLVLVAYAGDKPVGTGRIACTADSWWQISSLATSSRYEGKYFIGSNIMERLEEYARKHGGRRITLSATRRAREFYEKRGYSYRYPSRPRSAVMFKDL